MNDYAARRQANWVRYKFQYTGSSFDIGTYTFDIERSRNSGIGSTSWSDSTDGERRCSGTVTARKVDCPATKLVP